MNVVLQQVTLISMENVPLGLTYEASSPTLTYYPQTDPFGCVRICGIPMVAGNDTIRLTATAQGTVGGIATSQDYSLNIPIEIWPNAQDTIPDFTFSPDSLCAPMTVSFSSPLSAPGMTSTFSWNFSNGNTHVGSAPPNQTYVSGGDYPVTLQSVFSVPMLTQVNVTSVSNAWCGDLDEPNLPIVGCVGQPDLYFTVTDSRLAMERSVTVNNVQSTTWSNIAIPLAFPPFTLRIYDSDAVSADDLLGTFSFDTSVGVGAFSASGTAGQRTVQVQTVLSLTYTDTVVVHPLPDFTLSFDAVDGLVCASDAGLSGYAWALNGIPVAGESEPCVVAANGLWTLTGVNGFGCASSATLLISGLGVDESEGDATGFSVYPVPARDLLFVQRRDSQQAWDFTILDPAGRAVLQGRPTTSSGPASVDVSTLTPGSYVLRAQWGDRVVVKRFVVAPR